MKRIISLLIVSALLMHLFPLVVGAAEQPSSWATEQVNRAVSLELIPMRLQSNYTQSITRAEFCVLAVNLYERVVGKEISERKAFNDTNDINVQKLGGIGVINGVGNDLFAPYDTLTREQAAVTLANLAKAIGKPLDAGTASFADDEQISSWAIAPVGQVQAAGIMSGVGDNNFAPKGTYTREQSIATVLRLYDIVKIPVESISLNYSQETLNQGDELTLVHSIYPTNATEKVVTYESSDTNVITVSENGLMYAVAAGTAEITCTSTNGVTAKCYVTVKKRFLALNDIKVCIGDTSTQVENILGRADRIDPSQYDFNWHVYNSDYSRFIMVGIKNGIVEAIYSNSKGFETNYAKYGDAATKKIKGITFYTDKYNNEKIHACMIISNNVVSKNYGESFFRAQELENFDATNAFRANYGLQPFVYDELASSTARKHSQDMANRNYFEHTNLEGLGPGERLRNAGGSWRGCGENISAGRLLGVDSFDGWVNSQGHRGNMLESFNYLGVGYGYNTSSEYTYYMTQLFYEGD